MNDRAGIQKAIDTVNASRQTHVEWLEYYDNNLIDDCSVCIERKKYLAITAGDREHQIKCIEDYDHVISTLQGFL